MAKSDELALELTLEFGTGGRNRHDNPIDAIFLGESCLVDWLNMLAIREPVWLKSRKFEAALGLRFELGFGIVARGR